MLFCMAMQITLSWTSQSMNCKLAILSFQPKNWWLVKEGRGSRRKVFEMQLCTYLSISIAFALSLLPNHLLSLQWCTTHVFTKIVVSCCMWKRKEVDYFTLMNDNSCFDRVFCLPLPPPPCMNIACVLQLVNYVWSQSFCVIVFWGEY